MVTKIIHALEKKAQNEENFSKTQQLIANLENFLNELAYDQDVDLIFEKLSLATLLKAVGIHVVIDYNKLVDRIYAYMDLVNRFDGAKLFILLNLRSFVQDEDLQQLTDTAMLHEMKLLLVDSRVYNLLPRENRLVIDEDLCEF